MSRTKTVKKWALASVALQDAYPDFMGARQAMDCASVTMSFPASRRTFAILSLRAGMSPLHLRVLGGWEDVEMVQHYAVIVEEDLLREHKAHSPVDHLNEYLNKVIKTLLKTNHSIGRFK